jgi:hypothetical protein
MPSPDIEIPPELVGKRILKMRQAALLSGLSVDTLKRRYAHLIRKLSPRRNGMAVEDILSIGRAYNTHR